MTLPEENYCNDTVVLPPRAPRHVEPVSGNPFASYPPVKPPGEGGLCTARYYRVTEPLRVWRVFQSSVPKSAYGSWWNLEEPTDTSIHHFRQRDDVCKSWTPNPDRYHSCYLKTGTEIAVGPGQSVTCPDSGIQYPENSELQVYVNAYHDKSMFKWCSTPRPFPR